MKKYDLLFNDICEIQHEIDFCTYVENSAIDLISQCRFEDALTLLDLI